MATSKPRVDLHVDRDIFEWWQMQKKGKRAEKVNQILRRAIQEENLQKQIDALSQRVAVLEDYTRGTERK